MIGEGRGRGGEREGGQERGGGGRVIGEGRRGEREGGQEGAFADTVTSCSTH